MKQYISQHVTHFNMFYAVTLYVLVYSRTRTIK